jgi:hypothetical protein
VLAGGFLTASLKRFRRHGFGILVGLLAIGVLLVFFGISRRLYVSMGLLAALGIFVAVVNVFESVVFQTRVPNDLQGRVFAAQFAVCDGLQPISLAIIGALLAVVSAPTVLIASGIAILLASICGFCVKGLCEL